MDCNLGPSITAKHERTAPPAAVVQSNAAPGTAAGQQAVAAGSPGKPAEKDAAESESLGDSDGTGDVPAEGRDEDCEGSKDAEAGTGAADTQTQQPAAASRSPRELAGQPAAAAGVPTEPVPVGQHQPPEAGEEPEAMQMEEQEGDLPESNGQPEEGSDQAMADASSEAEGELSIALANCVAACDTVPYQTHAMLVAAWYLLIAQKVVSSNILCSAILGVGASIITCPSVEGHRVPGISQAC